MSFAHEFGIAGDALHDKRILLVDDEQELASMVAAILRRAGFRAVETAHCASEALRIIDARATSPDTACQLFVLDIMMPGMSGFDLLARIRERPAHASTPALFLSAKDEPFDRVNGLSLGADDYVTKPFLPQELVLRIAALLRRCYAAESPVLELAASRVNLTTAEVERADGTTVQLTAKEHEILSVLARNAGRIITIDALCEACWGTSFGYDNSLMAHIRRLREKIEAARQRIASQVAKNAEAAHDAVNEKIPVAADAAKNVAEKAHDALDSVAVKISGSEADEPVQDKVADAAEETVDKVADAIADAAKNADDK